MSVSDVVNVIGTFARSGVRHGSTTAVQGSLT